jgi:hypothetical protein
MKLWQLCVKQKWRRWTGVANPYIVVPRRKSMYVMTFQDHESKPCQIHKHSTRSKYRGYYIIQLRYADRLHLFEEHVLVKGLTKPQLVAYIKMLKGV